MKLVKTLIAVAVAACAMNANAGLTFAQASAVGISGGPLPLTVVSGPVSVIAFGDSPGVRLTPRGLTQTDPYSVISTGGSALLTFANAVSSYSFLWGSPDSYNRIDIGTTTGMVAGTTTYTGTTFLAGPGLIAGDGNNLNTRLFTITGNDGTMINSITFKSNGVAFEVATALAPVPEPETYALMLAGLGAVGFMARRRRAP